MLRVVNLTVPLRNWHSCHFGSGNLLGTSALRFNIIFYLNPSKIKRLRRPGHMGSYVLFGGISRKVPLWKTSRESRHGCTCAMATGDQFSRNLQCTFKEYSVHMAAGVLVLISPQAETPGGSAGTLDVFPQPSIILFVFIFRRRRGCGVAGALWRWSARQGTPLLPTPPISRWVNILWTFSEPSVNLQWTFSEPSVNLQWTYSESSVNIQWTFSQPSVNLQSTSSEPSVNIQSTFSEH
jgi:hypothetical protein